MDNEGKEIELTPEEQTAEAEATKEVDVDELRGKVAADLGIDPEDESDLLDKLVEREKAHREKLAGAIKQKRSWREKAQATSGKPKENPDGGKPKGKDDIDEIVDRKLNERWEARELESLGLSDELKTEVKDLAKLKGISVREASQLPYITSRKAEIEREERIASATPKRSNKGSVIPNFDPSKPLNPADFDFNSPEGIKAWNDAKAMRAKHRQQ